MIWDLCCGLSSKLLYCIIRRVIFSNVKPVFVKVVLLCAIYLSHVILKYRCCNNDLINACDLPNLNIPIEKSTLCFNLEEFDFFFFSFVKQYMLCIHFWYTIIIAIKTTKYIHVFINMTLLWSKIGKIWVCSVVPILKCYLFWFMGVWKKQALKKNYITYNSVIQYLWKQF